MKYLTLLLVICLFCIEGFGQNYAGMYKSTGYVFHPIQPAQLNRKKTLIQVAPNRYQLDLGNLGLSNYYFQFEVDASNNLVNWSAVGTTPAAPASGFMTFDNPSGTAYPTAPIPPGVDPYLHSTYNNTYDPVNKIFYLHYGYATGSSTQFQYTRQIYEKLELIPVPVITSVTPLTAAPLTEVTIKGINFTNVWPTYGVRFGGAQADSMAILSDTIIKAWVAAGNSGDVIVRTQDYGVADTFPGFVHIPVPPVTADSWQYLGTPGFSLQSALDVNSAAGKNNDLYVGYIDAVERRARVVRWNGNSWENIGGIISDSTCRRLKMTLDTSGYPVVMYADSSNFGYRTVKRFNGADWVNLNLFAQYPVRNYWDTELAVDKLNNIFVACVQSGNTEMVAQVLKFNGSWSETGNIPAADLEISLVIGKNNNPYLFYTESETSSYPNQASLVMYNGSGWTPVGQTGFTNTTIGNYSPVVQFDTTGNPVMAFQEDNGFERLSVFRYDGNGLNYPLGRFFSKGHARYLSQAIGNDNSLHVAYADFSYNNRGTVLSYNHQLQSWDTVGKRGALPFSILESTGLVKDSDNNMYIAFSDLTQNGRVSVMKYAPVATGFIWTGAVSTAWENPGNWSGGAVPSATSDVYINAGGIVLVNSDAEAKRIHVNPGASVTVTPGNSLTVFEP